jgi:hypothetical protein
MAPSFGDRRTRKLDSCGTIHTYFPSNRAPAKLPIGTFDGQAAYSTTLFASERSNFMTTPAEDGTIQSCPLVSTVPPQNVLVASLEKPLGQLLGYALMLPVFDGSNSIRFVDW